MDGFEQAVPRLGELVGREKERERLVQLIEENSIVAICGAAGIGKTALARSVIPRLGRYSARAFWTDAATPELLEAAMDYAWDEPVLLVLDSWLYNERLWTTLQRWAGRCQARRAVVISQERSQPNELTAIQHLAPLHVDDACSLFCMRWEAATGKSLGGDNTVAAIVHELGRTPAAIELAAKQSLVMTPAEILAKLRQEGMDAAGMEPFQRAFQVLWDSLPATLQQAACRCAYFETQFSLVDARRAFETDDQELASLCSYSLVVRSGDSPVPTFYIAPIVRTALLASPDEKTQSEIHRSHRAWCIKPKNHTMPWARARNLYAACLRDSQLNDPSALEQTAIELAPLALEHGRVDALISIWRPSPPATTQGRIAFAELLVRGGHLSEAEALAQQVLGSQEISAEFVLPLYTVLAESKRRQGKTESALEAFAAALENIDSAEVADGTRLLQRGSLRERHAGFLFEIGRLEDARAEFEIAADLFETGGIVDGLARVRHAQAVVLHEAGDVEAARRGLRAAVEQHQKAGHPRQHALALFDLGALELEQRSNAGDLLSQTCTALRTVGDIRQLALAKALLGISKLFDEDMPGAAIELEEALELAARIGDPTYTHAIQIHCMHVDLLGSGNKLRFGDSLVEISSRSDEERYALRLLRESWRLATTTLRISNDGSVFEVRDTGQALVGPKASRRVLLALAKDAVGPRKGLTSLELIRQGWDDVRSETKSSRNRLQVALSGLRKSGLGGLIIRREDRYAIDRSFTVQLDDEL